MPEPRLLTEAELKALTEDDLIAYEAELEGAYWGRGKSSFLDFCQMVEVPGAPLNDSETEFFADTITPAAHHKLLIDAIQKMADGEYHDVQGIMCFMPPGSAKSTYLSVLAVSWLLGFKPGTNVIATSYAQDVANRFARRARHIVRSMQFNKIMDCGIVADNQAVDNWSLTNGSDYRAAGLNGAVTSFRADWAIIDDPVSSREDADSEVIREKTYQGYLDNVDSRLKPGGKTIIVMTRWHEDDLAGRILGEQWKGQSGFWRGTDEKLWLIINLPRRAEHKDDPLGRAPGELLWSEYFREDETQRLEAAARRGGHAARTWASLHQQRPAPNEGAILAKHYWRVWDKKTLPECEQIYLCYDTAFEEGEENDYSAMTAWGVFDNISRKSTGEEYHHKHVILLGAWQERVSAVDLMDIAVSGYTAEDGRRMASHCQLFLPDRVLVEKRASGIQLIQEMQRKRVPVKAWLPKGKPGAKGKLPRAHAVAVILEQGSVWYVPGAKTDAVIDQCAAFPYGKHDDAVDTVTMALSYFRDRYIFKTADDELNETELKERLIERASDRRERRLYSDRPASRVRDDFDAADIESMSAETRRKLYG